MTNQFMPGSQPFNSLPTSFTPMGLPGAMQPGSGGPVGGPVGGPAGGLGGPAGPAMTPVVTYVPSDQFNGLGGAATGEAGTGQGGNTGAGTGPSGEDGTGGGTGDSYARGGRVMARRLSQAGRYGDSTLVHVNPKELRGLEAATGKRLTTNPDTGLPEAFNLGSALGIIGSIGGLIAAPFTGGSSLLLSAAGGGLGSFAGNLIEGKDFGTALGGGLLSGLLGYGLGGALGGLASAGTDEIAKEGMTQLAQNGVEAASSAAGAAPATGIGDPLASGAFGPTAPGIGDIATATSATPFGPPNMSPWDQVGDQFSRIGRGASNPDALWNTFGKNATSTTVPIALGLYGQGVTDQSGQGGYPQPQQTNYPTLPGPNQRKYMRPPSGWDYSTGKEWNYFTPAFADGGKVYDSSRRDYSPHHFNPDLIDPAVLEKIRSRDIYPFQMEEFIDEDNVEQDRFGRERPRDVRFAGGGPISGPGSGLDDAIPAVIDGRQPAKLSSGEYVVPAHAVSALGNGSTEDGVRQLNGMVGNVMMAKYGTAKRPRAVNPKQMMPR